MHANGCVDAPHDMTVLHTARLKDGSDLRRMRGERDVANLGGVSSSSLPSREVICRPRQDFGHELEAVRPLKVGLPYGDLLLFVSALVYSPFGDTSLRHIASPSGRLRSAVPAVAACINDTLTSITHHERPR